jgi:NADPH-dependent 2,4-dienoyl-CoA reductase/sulfur reductase-like enzyme
MPGAITRAGPPSGAFTRRQWLHGAAALAVAGCTSAPLAPRTRPRVVIVGGGVAGVSVLRRLAQDAPDALDLTLVEPKTRYTTCFYSNLYVGGLRSRASLQFDYRNVTALAGVRWAQDRVTAIDAAARTVRLSSGDALLYDRLVVAPGIALDFNSVPGWSQAVAERMPHAWIAGTQTDRLVRQLAAVPDGGLVVVIAPPNPYRCPPGPYERVSMMAHALWHSGRRAARIVVIDPKTSFSKQPLFQQGWETHYPGMIEWLPPMIHDGVRRVDPGDMSVETGFETYRDCALVNVIPRQTAGRVALDAGLGGDDGYCPIDPENMKSTRDPAIFVLGDAAVGGDMPKSAFAASSQAEVVAAAIRHELLDAPLEPTTYRNKCWSLIDANDSVFVGGEYRPNAGRITQVTSEISALDDSVEARRRNYGDSAGWYLGLTSALFG